MKLIRNLRYLALIAVFAVPVLNMGYCVAGNIASATEERKAPAGEQHSSALFSTPGSAECADSGSDASEDRCSAYNDNEGTLTAFAWEAPFSSALIRYT